MSDTTKKPSCPLCDRAESVAINRELDRDVFIVDCPACGHYSISREGLDLVVHEPNKPKRFLVSAATRAVSDRGERLELLAARIVGIWEKEREPATPFEVLDKVLLHIHNRTTSLTDFQAVQATDYPLFSLRSETVYQEFLNKLANLGYLEQTSRSGRLLCRLTLEGWGRIPALRKAGRVGNQAFVAMWFTPELQRAWEDGFSKALVEAGWEPLRIDRLEHNDKIDDRIVAEIRRSSLLIADFTGNRGGVYFEAGFALGLGIPVIWTVRADAFEAVHFDTRQYNHIVWEAPVDLREKLSNRIAATVALPDGSNGA